MHQAAHNATQTEPCPRAARAFAAPQRSLRTQLSWWADRRAAMAEKLPSLLGLAVDAA